MRYDQDKRIVATLDAGGTNFVFSAIRSNEEVIEPICLKSNADNLDRCLETIRQGFREVINKLPTPPVAISFAFPGPADYKRGIIGDLPNLPAFRGGVALGPALEAVFGIPVYINNDGSLFAYGEALAGALPEINAALQKAGSPKRYTHLLGITLGTGFGGGVVINDELLIGDNSCGGDIWCYRDKKHPDQIIETSVSIRAVKRNYKERSGDPTDLEPKDIFKIAEGAEEGNRQAAMEAFAELGEMVGDAVSHALAVVDGPVVIGGGLAGAFKYILPAMVAEMNSTLGCFGRLIPRMPVKAYDLTDEEQLKQFVDGKTVQITIPGTDKTIPYEAERKIGIMVSKLGASKAIALGAYAFALHKLDS